MGDGCDAVPRFNAEARSTHWLGLVSSQDGPSLGAGLPPDLHRVQNDLTELPVERLATPPPGSAAYGAELVFLGSGGGRRTRMPAATGQL